jgi:hypothetical protein
MTGDLWQAVHEGSWVNAGYWWWWWRQGEKKSSVSQLFTEGDGFLPLGVLGDGHNKDKEYRVLSWC